MHGIFKKIYNVVTAVIVGLVVVLAILLAGVRLVGLTPYTVLSGSMEPAYHVGSIIYVRDIAPAELKNGDAITYTIDGGTVVTHRIVEIVEDEIGRSFRTQGDANEVVDGNLVPAANIIGKPVFSIPYLGYVANVVQTPQGIVGVVGVCVILFLVSFIMDIIASLRQKEDEKSEC